MCGNFKIKLSDFNCLEFRLAWNCSKKGWVSTPRLNLFHCILHTKIETKTNNLDRLL